MENLRSRGSKDISEVEVVEIDPKTKTKRSVEGADGVQQVHKKGKPSRNPGLLASYYDDDRFNSAKFYSEQESKIPVHTLVWRGDATSKRAAAANVEQTNSSATSLFADFHAGTLSPEVTEMMMFLHANMKYDCLMPTNERVCDRYLCKFGKCKGYEDIAESSDDEEEDV